MISDKDFYRWKAQFSNSLRRRALDIKREDDYAKGYRDGLNRAAQDLDDVEIGYF